MDVEPMKRAQRVGFSLLYLTSKVEEAHFARFDRLAQLGYDGVEVPVALATEQELEAVRAALDGAGLAATAVGFAVPEANPVDPDPAVRSAAVDHLVGQAERAAALGAEILAGPLHSAYGVFTGSPPTDEEHRWAAEVLHTVASRTTSLGVRLAIEPLNRFESYVLNTAEGCRRMVEAVGHSAVTGVLDTHHAHIEENSTPDAIRAMGAALGHVQLSDSHRGTPGSGQVEFGPVLEALDDVQYEGWLVIEAFSRVDPAMGNALHIWRELGGGFDQVASHGIAVARGTAPPSARTSH